MLELRVINPDADSAWRPLRQGVPPDVNQIRRLPIDQLEVELGWKPRVIKMPEVTLKETQLIPASSTYFADFGPSVASRYEDVGGDAFSVLEQRMTAVYEPFVFVYPPHVSTRIVKKAGGTGLIVVPPPDKGVAAFAVWTLDDEYAMLIFDSPVTDDDAFHALGYLVGD